MNGLLASVEAARRVLRAIHIVSVSSISSTIFTACCRRMTVFKQWLVYVDIPLYMLTNTQS